MTVEVLSGEALQRWAGRPFSYSEIGRTAGDLPAGYAQLRRTRTLGPRVDFAAAASALMTWQVHRRAGLRVAASSPRAIPDAVVVLRIGWRRASVVAPCRIVYVVDEDDRQGFAYGTLPGHPESGEESFVVQRRPDGRVDVTISAFSRPASPIARLGGPLTSMVQRMVTDRYLRALD